MHWLSATCFSLVDSLDALADSACITMAEITITGWKTRDVRFPTSLDKTGSDAMNAAGDYSAAYCILETDSKLTGHGMV